MISHRCSLSHREYLTAVFSVKVRFLNYRAKKIKVITDLLLLLFLLFLFLLLLLLLLLLLV